MDTLLSLITMYSWDSTIFDGLTIPAQMDRDLLTDNLMLELGELELLYNDPHFMKFAIEKWSQKEVNKWQKLYDTTVLEYNPIENYNRTDTFTDTETRDLNVNSLETRDLNGSNIENRNLSGTENQTKNLAGSNLETRDLTGSNLETRDLTTTVEGDTLTTDVDTTSGGDTKTNFVQGYNGLGETQSEKETTTLASTNTKTVGTNTTQTGTDTGTVTNASTDAGTVANASTETGTDNKTMTDAGTVSNATTDAGTVSNNVDDTGTKTNVNIGSSSGNIGVKTTQEMIEEERKILELNMYDYIIQSFKCRFCILVY